ncbi:helix-turn-helix transcriptional regulator [Veillonella intestinalis]|uniref:helix-turn-helix transcriptional regulator n=1 Tax=Veillonella intestinalis TaxID=2941341 RepID=UPI00203B19E8|nr:helix-turn-helix transcriptional regulator [Veillonella intestinalis]
METVDNSKITLKAARVNKNLTQEQAAKLIGISVFTLINYESGKSFPDVPIIERIEKVYDIPYHRLNFLV